MIGIEIRTILFMRVRTGETQEIVHGLKEGIFSDTSTNELAVPLSLAGETCIRTLWPTIEIAAECAVTGGRKRLGIHV